MRTRVLTAVLMVSASLAVTAHAKVQDMGQFITHFPVYSCGYQANLKHTTAVSKITVRELQDAMQAAADQCKAAGNSTAYDDYMKARDYCKRTYQTCIDKVYLPLNKQ